MGFMAGFGSAFSRSFEAGRDRAAQEKQDAFRLTYQDFMQRQQQYDEWNREDAKAVKTAQDYERMYNLPEGSWGQIYNWVKSGHDADQIQEWVQKGQWSVDETTPAPDKAAPATGVDVEMQGVGLSEAPPMEQPQAPQQRDTGLFGNLLGNLSQKGKKKTQSSFERRRAGALEQVAGASGRSIEEVQGVMAGYKPPEMPETNVKFTAPTSTEKDPFSEPNAAYIEAAQAKTAAERNATPENIERARVAQERVRALQDRAMAEAEADARSKGLALDGAGATVWKDGKYQYYTRVKRSEDGKGFVDIKTGQPVVDGDVIPVNETEQKARDALWDDLKEPFKDLRVKAVNAEAAVVSAGIQADIVRRTNGEVLKPITSGVFQWVDKNVRDAATFAEKMNSAFATTPEGKPVAGVDAGTYESLVQAERELMKFDKNNLGAQKALFETQKALMAYRLGMAMGQEGRGLAETERKMFSEMAAGGVGVDQFYQGMSNLLVPMVTAIDNEGVSIVDQADDQFFADYNYVPDFVKYQPLTEKLKLSKEAGAMWNEILPLTKMGVPVARPPQETGAPAPQTPAGPAVGTTKQYQGKTYVFKGGNPKDPNNWEAQ